MYRFWYLKVEPTTLSSRTNSHYLTKFTHVHTWRETKVNTYEKALCNEWVVYNIQVGFTLYAPKGWVRIKVPILANSVRVVSESRIRNIRYIRKIEKIL